VNLWGVTADFGDRVCEPHSGRDFAVVFEEAFPGHQPANVVAKPIPPAICPTVAYDVLMTQPAARRSLQHDDEEIAAQTALDGLEREPRYTPTPAEIAAACAVIRAEWSEFERPQRAGLGRKPWFPPGSHGGADAPGHAESGEE
jgi:hypothetical protein